MGSSGAQHDMRARRPSAGSAKERNMSSVAGLENVNAFKESFRKIRVGARSFPMRRSQRARHSRHDSSGTSKTVPRPMFLWPTTTEPSAPTKSDAESDVILDNLDSKSGKRLSDTSVKRQSRKSQSISILSGRRDQRENDTSLDRILSDSHKQLEESESERDAEYYARVVEKPLGFVEGVVGKLREQVNSGNQSNSPPVANLRESLTQKEEILRITKKLLGAFAPIEYPSKVIEKYWGGISLLLVDSVSVSKFFEGTCSSKNIS